MKGRQLKRRRGLSTVISEIILTAVVLAVGFSVWGYSSGSITITTNDYVGGVQNQMSVLIERFTIEHITYMSSTNTLRVWVYNYGGNSVVVDLYAFHGDLSWSTLETSVASKSIVVVEIPLNIASGNELAIKAISRRGNDAYLTYLVP